MLEHTFLHIPGIGPKTEQMLWAKGVLTWEDFLALSRPFFSKEKDGHIRGELERSRQERRNPLFFARRLQPSEFWRLYESFADQTVFLDIETSGGGPGGDEITVIGLYDGQTVQTFVNGKNLMAFEGALTGFNLLVTFNGSCFDLPYLQRFFRHLTLPPIHIDLRFFLKRVGLKGGLKAIEEQVGLPRDPQVMGLDGYDAVLLWQAYCRGEISALERLILYNTMDIVQLKPLLEWGIREMKNRLLPFGL